MWEFINNNWEFILSFLAVLGGGAFGLWRFLVVRRAELAWKKTEFIFLQAYYLDTNPELTEIVMILEGRHPKIELEALFDDGIEIPVEMRKEVLHKLDKLLNITIIPLYYWRIIAILIQ